MEIEEVIYDFLNEFGYTEDERIEGVIFYGSYQTNIKDIILKIIKERYKIYMIE